MSTAVPMGIVSLKAEGAYAADNLYKKGMWVTSSGSSYAYINPTPSAGVSLANTSHWQQIASIGGQDLVDAAVAARDAAQGYKDAAAASAAQLASGVASPAGTYANLDALNTANSDHSKIYITLNDGNWCYHNGTAFVSGGQYQAVLDAPSVFHTNLFPELYPQLSDFTDGVYISAENGNSFNSASLSASAYVKVTPGTIINLRNYSTFAGTDQRGLAFYTDIKKFVSGFAYQGNTNISLTVPSTAAYIRITVSTVLKETYLYSMDVGGAYDAKLEDIYTTVGMSWPVYTYTTGAYISYLGNLMPLAHYAYSSPIPVRLGDSVEFWGAGESTVISMIATCDASGENRTVVVPSVDTGVRKYTYNVVADGYIVLSFNFNFTNTLFIKSADPGVRSLLVDVNSLRRLTSLDFDVIDGKYINYGNGVETPLGIYACSSYIPVYPGESLTIYTACTEAAGYAFYNEYYNYISGHGDNLPGKKILSATAPASAKYIRFSVLKNVMDVSEAAIDINLTLVQVRDIVNAKEDKAALLDISMFDDIAVCGDSYTAAQFYHNNTLVGDNESISWGKILGRMAGIEVGVYASSGADTNTWQSRSNCLPKVLTDPARQLYIFSLAINDYSYVPLGTIADINVDYTQNPNTYYGNFGRIIDQLLIHAPNAKIILSKCWLTNSVYYSYSTAATEAIAAHYNIAYIDTADNDYFVHGFYKNNLDGGHPTAPLQSGMAKAMKDLVSRCLEDNLAYFVDYYPQ